jgi:endonuclease/exonuclease/phosphatase family metal-dependent hydrolase
MIVYLILVFSYYVSFDLALPLPRGSIAPLAAAIFGLSVIGAIGRGRQSTMARFDMTAIVASGALTVIAVVYAFLVPPVPAAQPSPSGTPRVMTYNLHSAFSRQGRLDPEAIARVIEAAHPDVVALQEVSRGWMIDASLDLPAWLSRRLGIPIVFQPTADPVWGNALMSRSGFLYHNSAPLPGLGTRIGRGYLYASIDLGMRGPTLVIATHLHHIDNEPEPRMAQIPVILRFWNNAPRTIIMGDMNSEPTWPEMQLFRDAGMQDAWAQAGEGPGLTWPSDDPVKRIDWIWLSPDLRAVHAETTLSTASDHQGVIADVQLP